MALTFTKSTDTAHKIKLDSELVHASWVSRVAPAGGTVKFLVVTAFVGNGAKIKVTGKSEGGKKLGKVSSVIRNNSFTGELTVPDDMEEGDVVYFEVDLSANGLSGESNRILATPPVVVSNLAWSAKEARRGDFLKLSASVKGCKNNTEATITIYEYDSDGVHDRIAELPATVRDDKIEVEWEYEYHEDTDEIPTDAELKEYGKSYNPPEYFFVVEIAGQKFGLEQESKLLTFKDSFEAQFLDRGGAPLADRKYKITLPDGKTKEGKTDADGYIRIEDVPPGQCQVDFPPDDEAKD